MLESFATELAAELGYLSGQAVEFAIAAFVYLILVLLFWGLPCERIISKAGYKGKAYWKLLALTVVPVVLCPLISIRYGEDSDITLFSVGVGLVSLYLGLLALAFLPWSVTKESKQFRKQSSAPSIKRINPN